MRAPAGLNTEGKQFVHARLEGGELAGPAGLLPNTRPARTGEKMGLTATGLGALPASIMIQFGEAEPVTAEVSGGSPGTSRLEVAVPEGVAGAVTIRILAEGQAGRKRSLPLSTNDALSLLHDAADGDQLHAIQVTQGTLAL